MVVVEPGEQVKELLFFFGAKGGKEFGMNGIQLRISLQERLLTFFGQAKQGGASVFCVCLFLDETFRDQSFCDLHAGGPFDEHFLADLFFIRGLHDSRLDQH